MPEIKILTPSVSWSSNTYLLTSGNECAVIDPSSHYDMREIRGKVKYIILTHAHYDHMLDIDEWVTSTDASVIVSRQDIDALADPVRNCARFLIGEDKGYFGNVEPMDDGDILTLGEEKIRVISTPGHTQGSVCLLTGDALFSGDTIFERGGFGKYTFPGGNFPDLRRSIMKLCELDGGITVYSGHGGKFTIEEYKKYIFR